MAIGYNIKFYNNTEIKEKIVKKCVVLPYFHAFSS